MQHAEGMLFDTAYLEPEIYLWVRSSAGALIALTIDHFPLFYLAGPRPSVERAAERIAGSDVAQAAGWTHRSDFWSGAQRRVLAVRTLRPSQVTPLVRRLLHQDHRLQAYDVDIDPVLGFHSRHDLFPLARVALSWDETPNGRRLRFIRALDDPLDPAYRLPSLRRMIWRLEGSPLVSLGEGNALLVEVEGRTHRIAPEDGPEALHSLNALLDRYDPDAIITQHGDQHIFPWLLETSERAGVPLRLDRLAPLVQRHIRRAGKSLMVYSGIMYKAPDYPLLGRWHLDLTNSFFGGHTGLEGVLEMARLSRLPVQHQARRSGGNAITAMEIHLALRRGILVPFIKDQVERFRSAAELLQSDKGGLTFYPPEGLWEQVVEVDYAQMYPTIMAVHNVSPETMNCSCCPGLHPVPGTTHHTCTRRRGLVPDALQSLLTKRLRYKQLLKQCSSADRPLYEARSSALKWTLVTTFGYQGYHNAKFGLIEAHEAITAWGRESLLIAKELFEGAGFGLLHGLTDSLYLVKPGYGEQELADLCGDVLARTGLTLAVEGVYDWICFLPSKQRRSLSVATRYFGRFSDGTMKLRGIKVRQRSTPPFIRSAQERFLAIMQSCRDPGELEAAAPRLVGAYREAVSELWRGGVPVEDLVIPAQTSQDVSQYRSNAPVAVCLRRLAQHGISVSAGQTVHYVMADRRHPDPQRRYVPVPFLDELRTYDAAAYQALLLDAFREVCEHLQGCRSVWEPPEQQNLFALQ